MLKKIILGIIVLELLNIGAEYIKNGAAVFLPYTKFNAPALYYDMDSLYGVTRQKNASALISYPWGGIPYKTNSMGFRDDEYNTNGILVVGNSFVEGFGVKKEERFTELLEKKTGKHLNNVGSGGVWSALQSLVITEHLIKEKKVKKAFIILTPGEILNIDTRTPKTDPTRNFPYTKNDSILFYKSLNNSFGQKLSIKNKTKRFSKSLLISKIYTSLKYYGSAKVEKNEYVLDHEKFNWLLTKFNSLNAEVDILIINNLGFKQIKDIHNYEVKYDNVFVIDFPDNYSNYFTSNGHLNDAGNRVLAKLIHKKTPSLK